MKNKIFISLFLLVAASCSVFSQTANTTITYGGFQACGGCDLCGADYWCVNSQPSYCGNTAACRTDNFFDPVPAGNIITGVSIVFWAEDGWPGACSSVNTSINSAVIGNGAVSSFSQCSTCTSLTLSNSYSCPTGLPGYNYGGNNGFTLCPNGSFCIQRAVITFTYTVASVAPTGATASPNPICSGAVTLNRIGGSLGTGSSWNWYSGSCGGTFVGTGSSISVSPASTTTYYVRASGGCGTTACASVTVTVNTPSLPPTSATASPNPTCGGATTLTEVGGTLGSGAVYNWYTGSCGGSLVGTGASISVSPSSTTIYYVLASGTCNITPCATVTVTVNSFSTAPSSASASPSTVCAGVATTLTETGGSLGAGAIYNWYSGSCGGTLVGTGPSISVSPSSTTNYYVRAQGTCNTTACAMVTVTANQVPFATATPSAPTICSGNATAIVLNSFTPGTSFSWTVTQSGVTGAVAGNGATIAQTLSVLGTTPGTATYTVTPVAAGCIGFPITVVVTVNPIPVATATPATQTICSGAAPAIVLTSNITGTLFNWTVVQTGVSGASTSSGSTIADVLTATGVTAGTAVYSVTPVAGGCPGIPITVTITVNPSPIAIATPSSQTFCSGSTTGIVLTSNVAGASFTWTVVQTGVSGGAPGTGLTIADVLNTTGSSAGTAVYTITPSANTCPGTPITVTINVNKMDSTSFSYSATTFCQTGVDPAPTITGLPGGVFSSTAGLVFISTATGLVDLSLSTLGTYIITYATNGICPNTGTQTLTITGAPAAGFSYPASPFCQFAANPSPTFAAGAFGGVFSSLPAGLSFVNTNTGVINLLTSLPGTYTIKNVIAASGGCAADSATSTVTINPTPIATATLSPDTICSGTATSIVLGSSLAGTSYGWTVVQTNAVGGATGGGPTIIQTLTTTGAGAGTVVYSITPTVGTCIGSPIKDTVTVNAITIATATPPTQAFCSGGTTAIALTGNIPGTTFTWAASESGVTGALFGFGNTIAQTLTAAGTSPGTAVYTVTPSSNGCLGNGINVTITVNPADNSSFNYTSATYCQSGSPQSPSITGLPGGVFSSVPAGLSINASTGTINLSTSALNAYTLTYTTNGICPSSTSIIMTITNSNPSANFSYPGSPFCQNGTNPHPVYTAGSSAGIFSAVPAGLTFVNLNTGEINLGLSAPGVYTVTNTIPASGTCLGTSAVTTVTITPSDNAAFSYTSATYCISGPNQSPTISGLHGGTFHSSPAGLAIDTTTGVISLSTSVLGTYVLSYSTHGPCPNTSSILMTIDSVSPSGDFHFSNVSYCQNASNPSPVFNSGSSAGSFSSTPSGLVFVQINTGQIDLAASGPGTYIVTNTIPASGNCSASVTTATVTITRLDNASFVYSSATYCTTGPNETPTITGLPGGVFTSTPVGLLINPATGTINLAGSAVGSYILSYTTNGACHNTSHITMTITTNTVFASFSYPSSTYCQNGTNPFPIFAAGASAGVFTVTPIGLAFVHINTGQVDLAGSTPGTYTVTNTIPASGGCAAVVATSTITISPSDNASFFYPSATYCTTGTPQTPTITGLAGGTFSSTPAGLNINPATGVITLTSSALGVYTLTYTTNGSCPNSTSITMTITNTTPFANFGYPASPFCQNGGNPFPTFGPGASAGIFTSAPAGLVFVQVNTGEIDLTACTPGTYTVTNTIPASGTCGAVTATTTVVIGASDNASFVYSSATYCLTGPNQTPVITGLPGGVFSSIPPGLSVNPATGAIDLTTSSVGAYTLRYSTNGACPNTSSIVMTITNSPNLAGFSYAGSPYCQNAANPYPTFVSGASAGFFTASPAGLVFIHVNTGQLNLSASTPGTYTVTNTIPAGGGCAAVTATSTVTITAADNAAFTYPSATYCTSGNPQTPTITGLLGGTFSAIPIGLALNPSTGTINLALSALGAYTLTYTTNGVCPNSSSITMTITNTTPFASFSYPASPFCQLGNNPFPTFGPGASAGTYTAAPAGLVFVNVNTGQINLALSAPGTYTVTNTIPVSGTCGAVSATSTVIIHGAPTAIATIVSHNICTGSSASIALTSSTSGANFTWTVIETGLTGASSGTGASISQVLTLTPPGTVTGSAVYTITPSANGCIGLPITVPVTLHPIPKVDTSAVVITPANCGSETGKISGISMSIGQSPFHYVWKDSAGTVVGDSAVLRNVAQGKYTLTVTDSSGCSISTGIFVVTSTAPVVAAFTSNPITGETPLTVNFTNASSNSAVNYIWHFGTGDSSIAVNPTYTYVPLGNFIVCLKADNGFGCWDTACAKIDVFINSVFIIPNVFTPNGDGVNDVFTVHAVGLKTLDAEVYNRWGEKEFEWHSTNGGWDGYTASGVPAPAGTYYYIISATGIDAKKYAEKGAFTLIRAGK